MQDRVEIRMFDRLLVRRADGTLVRHSDWKAGKTTDLLRMLALVAGQPVRTETLVETLWPDVSSEAGQASLRTATSRIRTTIGCPCVLNHLGTLTLVGAWVDTIEFEALAEVGSHAWRIGDAAAVVRAAHRAEALYAGDFHAYSDDQTWASEARSTLALRRRQLLADAAESALSLFWLRDAIDLATIVLRDDPSSERAHRTLMSAYAGLGRAEQALRQFEQCRTALAEELGADPSEQTRALHVSILGGMPLATAPVPFTGRQDQVRALVDALDAVHRLEGRGLVCVVGAPGSGRHALVEAALRTVGASAANIDVWGPLDSDAAEAGAIVTDRVSDRDSVLPDLVVVLTTPEAVAGVVAAAAATARELRIVECPPLDDEEVATLAALVMQGTPTPAVTAALSRDTGNLAGRVVATVRDWLANGRVVATDAGVDLWDDTPLSAELASSAARFRLLAGRLADDELRMCEVVAVAPDSVSVEDVVRVLGQDRRVDAVRRSARDVLERLVDLGVLEEHPVTEQFAFRDPRTRTAAASWLRPSERARLARLWDGSERELVTQPSLGRRASDRGDGDRRQGRRGRRASD